MEDSIMCYMNKTTKKYNLLINGIEEMIRENKIIEKK